MTIKSLLKVTLSALLLLGAGTTAYAAGDGPVTLKNGDKVTWDEFVNVINNPNSLVGSADSTALHTARENYKTALETAKTKAQAVIDKKKTYDDADQASKSLQATIASKTAEWSQANGAYNDSIGKVNTYETALLRYERELEKAQTSLQKLEDENQVNPKGLTTAYTKAGIVKGLYDAYIESGGDGEAGAKGEITYEYKKVGLAWQITFSFDGSHVNQEGWNTVNVGTFYRNLDEKTLSKLYVDLGSDEGTVSITYSKDLLLIIDNVYDKLESMTKDPQYLKTDPELVNSDEYKTIDGNIKTYETYIENLGSKTDAESLIGKAYAKATKEKETADRLYKELYDDTPEKIEDKGYTLQLKYYTEKDTTTGKTVVEKAYDEWQTAITEEATANADVTTKLGLLQTEQNAYNQAVADNQQEGLDNYKEITITANIVTDKTVNRAYDGSITGEKTYIITKTGTGPLFSTFTGSLANVGVNGTFATSSNGARGSVASWNGSIGVFYDANGDRTNCKTIGELGYAARELFGISFADGGKLVDKAANTTVYSITAYTSPTVATPYFALLNGMTFVTASGNLKVSENTLIKSEDPLDTVDNVFYSDGGKYVCQRMVITDKNDFYAPVEISAAEVVYDRVFTPGNMHAVCLPFELNYQNYLDEVKSLCTYESESKNTFWFVKREGTVAANTPMLLTTTGNFDLKNLANVTIKQTPAEQKVWTDGTDGTRAYGTFAKVNRGELAGEEAASEFKIYGLTVNSDGKQVFRPAGENATFTAFRMAILSNETLTAAGAPSAMRRIGILDEKGVEITDEVISAVESVVAPESSLKVVGGQGVIRFSSDCDYGKVAVYSLDGRMITVAEVVEGTTTVDVNSGIYIVEGKKIQVK